MDARAFERDVTLGFKLISGHYGGSITKDAIADLPKKARDIPWGTLQFETLINEVGEQLDAIDVFRYWRSWNLSLIEATSDAVAINFLLMLTRDWERKGRPAKGSGIHEAFVRNAVGLLDRSVFEYVSGVWGGSGDSRIASNLAGIAASPVVWTTVSTAAWGSLIEEVVERGEIHGQPYTSKLDPKVVLLLYYRNVIRQMRGPDDLNKRVHVDHIIPKKLFESESDEALVRNRHHISNLALLPATENIEKSGQRLTDIKSSWVKDSVANFSDIPRESFGSFEVPGASSELRAFRGPLISQDLGPRRAALVLDPTHPK